MIAAAEAQHAHWAFYAFREDVWDGMDYEIGGGGLGQRYWEAIERGETPEPSRRPNAMSDVLRKALRGEPATR